MRRTVFRFALMLCLIPASGLNPFPAFSQTKTPVYVNVSTAAGTWAVGQDVLLLVTVVASQGSLTPTGTVQFYGNGQPSGSPVTLAASGTGVGGGEVAVPFSTPGSYTLTATYSGDANFAAGASVYPCPFTVEIDPATILPTSSPASLTLLRALRRATP
jgi:hypothetical protein